MDWVSQHLVLVAVVAGIVLLALALALRPRQKVRLSDPGPPRPHLAYARSGEGRGLAAEAAAAASDVAGEIMAARVHDQLPGASGPPDDLLLLKGVGPKLAALLNERGLSRYDQIAKLSDGQADELDSSLGAFRGRLARDRIVEQADYLARGDRDGFEQKFGKL